MKTECSAIREKMFRVLSVITLFSTKKKPKQTEKTPKETKTPFSENPLSVVIP